jgi:hypothetical protein
LLGFCVAQPAKAHAIATLSADTMNVFMLCPSSFYFLRGCEQTRG